MTLPTPVAAGGLCAIAFAIGGLPIIAWLVQGLTKQNLATLGTGNISVSAAFYHGGTRIGLLAVLSEALKGIAVVLLARSLFPGVEAWEIMALIALVLGRFIVGRGAGTTNVVWGYVAHDWVIAATVFVLSGILFSVVRQRQFARLGVLAMLPILEAVRRPEQPGAIAAATVLSLLIAGIYQLLPDDLALAAPAPTDNSRKMFQYLRGRDVIGSLNDKPQVAQMGHKAATLAQLKQAGYAVPRGWVLPMGAAARSLIQHLEKVEPEPWQQRWIVRSSAVDEDSLEASGAGQYESIAQITDATGLEAAIEQCRAAYHREGAVQYRRDRGLADQAGLALLVQPQIQGQYSGVAFSRDPVEPGAAVVVEALAGGADQVVSGQVTPEQYQVTVSETEVEAIAPGDLATLPTPPANDAAIPSALIQQVALLARHLERHYHGIPQDIEWSFDGEMLWLLQARPITTLPPIWTRKIAAEVIPGVIRPLTWSINRPLTCGVWGEIFTIVLGSRATGLNFEDTATLHYSRAYFNATLLGDIFRRMGLPPESLEFLTMGAKFSKPPIASTLKNVPGLLRLIKREWTLLQDFQQDDRINFIPTLTQLAKQPASSLSVEECLSRIELILTQLNRATYYNILAPLGFALRRSLFKIPETALDQSQQPEVASIQAVKGLAKTTRSQSPKLVEQISAIAADQSPDQVWTALTQLPDGEAVSQQLDAIAHRYGYLSEVGTDIAVPTWYEDPQPVRDLFLQFLLSPPTTNRERDPETSESSTNQTGWRYRQVQPRLNLKGRVAEVYLRLLAELRWSLLALEQAAIARTLIDQPGDTFFLTYRDLKTGLETQQSMQALVAERRSQFAQHEAFSSVPFVVYGDDPPPDPSNSATTQPLQEGVLQGIGASAGQVQGPVKVLTSLKLTEKLAPQTILVVPYTDAGWAPVLAQAAGLVAEVGGRLSHGAIVAREYGIPAVMNIEQATQQFHDGQLIRLDGRTGTVEILSPPPQTDNGG
ncbi:glycerol-3-phosphate acyltransferase [Leptolyngbya iicbica]|uniref:Pyruvate phosphate dikinase PEP/pyruvate-binding protein n=2 Tax=Cyanophyceae TaxID=3028117 RepID=A0A4Q7E9D6_9CYAN|nr:glycerol-3-phosphate acyltransferase [Leptolyngbya sp. LK]RZM79188.1 pyruvate phosphate dikinase PEP/pyruvate-binding protein [Leptolyngbya sp. LK]